MNKYDIKITGKDAKRFIHNLHKSRIQFLNIEFNNKSVIIQVNEEDYKKIMNIKTIYEIEVVKMYGMPRLKQLFKKYKIFLITLLFGILFFLSLTNIIFEVEVVHNNKDLREMIMEELKREGITKYKLVVPFKTKEKIKQNIQKKYSDTIEWLEIEREGTKYIVKVEERKKKNTEENQEPRNIIAKKNGMIKKIEAASGTVIAKKDQYVKKGDILISGNIYNKEEIKDQVVATGEVYAETWYTVKVELPYHYREEKLVDNKQKTLEINWLNKTITLFDFKNFKNSNSKDLFSIKNNILPFSISISEKQEKQVIDKIYSKENAIIEASTIAQTRLKDKLGVNIDILYEKNLKLTEEDSKIVVTMFYKVYENIVDYQKLENNLENQEPVEE